MMKPIRAIFAAAFALTLLVTPFAGQVLPAEAASCTQSPTTAVATSSNWVAASTGTYYFVANTAGLQQPQAMPCDTMSLTFGASPTWSNNANVTLYCGTTPIGNTSSFGTSSTVSGATSGICDQNSPTGASWYLKAVFSSGTAPLPMTATVTWSGNQLATIPPPIVLPAGNANVEAHETDVASGSIAAYRFQGVPGSPFAVNGQVTTLAVYAGPNTTSTLLNLGLYSEVSGAPSHLIRACNSPQPISAAGWVECNIPQFHVTMGQNYWLAVFAADSSNQIALADDSVSVSTEALLSTGWTLTTASTSNGLPTTWTTSGHTQTTPSVRYASINAHI